MTYDCIVVLSCGMKPNDYRISGWKPDLDAHIRITAAAELFHLGVAERILVSGGKMHGPANPSLAEILDEELRRKYEVPKEKILVEERSVDTTENAEFCADILNNKGLESIALVTNEYHMPRAMTAFRMHGFCPDDFPAEYIIRMISAQHSYFAYDYLSSPENLKKVRMNKLYHAILKTPLIGEKALRILAHRKIKQC